MPKTPKKAKAEKQQATTNNANARRLDEPSRAGSHSSSSEVKPQVEEQGQETQRYASITGTRTPPQDVSEKA
jgi:hypothetical protein